MSLFTCHICVVIYFIHSISCHFKFSILSSPSPSSQVIWATLWYSHLHARRRRAGRGGRAVHAFILFPWQYYVCTINKTFAKRGQRMVHSNIQPVTHHDNIFCSAMPSLIFSLPTVLSGAVRREQPEEIHPPR